LKHFEAEKVFYLQVKLRVWAEIFSFWIPSTMLKIHFKQIQKYSKGNRNSFGHLHSCINRKKKKFGNLGQKN